MKVANFSLVREITGRSRHAIRADAAVVDVAVERWQGFTGDAARREDGRTFGEVTAERRAEAASPDMGRRAHKPDPASRRQVEAMAAYGIPELDIARVVGVDPKTLCKHYLDELDMGETKANAQVVGFLFNAARSGNVTAQIPANRAELALSSIAGMFLKRSASRRPTPSTYKNLCDTGSRSLPTKTV